MLAISCAAISLAVLAVPSNASAASYSYCPGCTIYGGGMVKSGYWFYISLDYVNRLSGPSSGVTIGAIAQYADNGQWGSYVLSTARQVQHGYNGARPAWGAATNFGAGNYGFNAHVNY